MTHFDITKTADGGMTTYQVTPGPDGLNAAICAAYTEAAKDVWPHVAVVCGTYSAADLSKTGRNSVYMSADDDFPKPLQSIIIVCGAWRCRIDNIPTNLRVFFRTLAQFEALASVKQTDRLTLSKAAELGKLVCEARLVLPSDMKAIAACCGDDPLRPSLSYPAIDLDRRCIVATDGALLVAKKITLAYIHYEDKVPETFYLPKEVERMQGEVTVKLYERGCTVIGQNATEVSVEHEYRYPKWHAVWPPLRGGMTLVDSKAMTKVVKGAMNGLPQKGKCKEESLLLTHYPASANLTLRGYDGAEMVNEQRIADCIATDEVPYRMGVNPARLLKALALQPKTMWMGYSEYDTLPTRLVMEDAQAEMAVEIYRYDVDDLRDALMQTEKEYVVSDTRRLYHCFDKDGWLLEQVETKYPSSGEKPETPKPTKKAKVSTKSTPKRERSTPTIQTTPTIPTTQTATPLSIADRLREALRARLAA